MLKGLLPIFLAVLVLVIGMMILEKHSNQNPKGPKEWPNYSIRAKVKDVKVTDIKMIRFTGQENLGLLTSPEEMEPFLEGLKAAVLPGDPKEGFPTNVMNQLELVLKNGQIIGPEGFAIESGNPNQAFGRKFYMSLKRQFPQLRLK